MKKRRAARDVFREQNVANFDSSLRREAIAAEQADSLVWLESLARNQGANEQELLTSPDGTMRRMESAAEPADMPDWLSDAAPQMGDEADAPVQRTREYYKNIHEAAPLSPAPAPLTEDAADLDMADDAVDLPAFIRRR
ncbi:MAG: hypothetical protein AAF653_20030, partial [Chloroflexota bacterium]